MLPSPENSLRCIKSIKKEKKMPVSLKQAHRPTQLFASIILKSIILDNITKCGEHAKRYSEL